MNQNYDEIIKQMIKRITSLETELGRLAVQQPLFDVKNVPETQTTLSADQNDYDPENYDLLWLFPSGADRTITGFSGGVVGRFLYVRNGAAGLNLLFAHDSASSTAGNRIITTTGATITMAGRRSALFVYGTHLANDQWYMIFPSS